MGAMDDHCNPVPLVEPVVPPTTGGNSGGTEKNETPATPAPVAPPRNEGDDGIVIGGEDTADDDSNVDTTVDGADAGMGETDGDEPKTGGGNSNEDKNSDDMNGHPHNGHIGADDSGNNETGIGTIDSSADGTASENSDSTLVDNIEPMGEATIYVDTIEKHRMTPEEVAAYVMGSQHLQKPSVMDEYAGAFVKSCYLELALANEGLPLTNTGFPKIQSTSKAANFINKICRIFDSEHPSSFTVDEGYSGWKEPIVKLAESNRGSDVIRKIESYHHIIIDNATKTGIDANLIRAIIYEEQTHNKTPDLEWCDKVHSVGPMAIYDTNWGDYSREDMREPKKNIEADSQILPEAYHSIKQSNQDSVPTVAELATYYNTGKSDPKITEYGERVENFYEWFNKNFSE